MRLILTGGGTGGHIYPLVAVYDEIKKATSLEVLYIGKKGGMEEGIAAKNGLDFFGLEIVGMNRGKPWQLFRLALLYCRAVYKSIAKIRSFKPDIIFATGGYACFPACFAAIILRIPFCLHEQNALPGKANLFLARFAFKTFVSFSSSLRKFRTKRPVILTGLPVRDVFFNCSTQKTREILGFSSSDRVILITGGSRGAGFLNALGEILVGWAKCNNKLRLLRR
jgi:UDP-N-acetylglucosamine--N-acetylmuramyl-(pentapeptide) pyrophosphoryl-undecaprenol N-acetylglucosamine transferase